MFYLFKKDSENILHKIKEINFTGCNNGIICKILKRLLLDGKINLPEWEVNLEEEMKKEYNGDYHFIVKYKLKETGYTEITKVYGYNYKNWTPVLLQLKEYNNVTDEDKFKYPSITEIENVFTINYLQGFIDDKRNLLGTWNFPNPTPTNSTMLYKDCINYFISIMKNINN